MGMDPGCPDPPRGRQVPGPAPRSDPICADGPVRDCVVLRGRHGRAGKSICAIAGRPAGRSRPQPAAAKSPADGHSPASPLCGLRGVVHSLRVRDGHAVVGTAPGRMDDAHAAMDAGGVDVADRRAAPRRAVVVRCAGLGRLLGLGPGRERRVHALARRHGVHPFVDGAGAPPPAADLEREPGDLAFLLTIFGTFLTRSGILASVHSFTQSLIGPVFVAFLGLVMVASLLALLARLPQIRDEGWLDSPLSREAMMLLNNVVLLTMAFTIFVGTIFPLIVEAATGAKVTVGPPFFNRLFVPLGVVLLMVMGLGTALRWGRSGAEEMRKLGWLIGITLLTVTALGFAGIRGAGLVALGAVCFVTVAQVGEYVRGALARRAATSESFPVALRSLFALNRQRYYGYLTHLGLAIVITGIVGSQSGRIEVQRQLLVGQAMQVGGYTLRLDGLVALPGADRLVVAAPVAVLSGNSTARAGSPGSPGALDILRPSENFYRQARTPVPTPAVRSTWRQDLYVVLMAFDPAAQSAVLRAVVTPLVSWIWVGGTIMVIAGVLAGWPSHPT